MAEESSSSSTGETPSNFLEKITPKDLVIFSPAARKVIAKNDFSYLGVDYDLQLPKEDDSNLRVWGLPYIRPNDPIPLGLFSGLAIGTGFNLYRSRPPLSNIYVHLVSAALVALTTSFAYKSIDKWRLDRELVTWDYVKKHPQDFPEVFNPPKKYQDLLLPWKISR